jgi:exonuclease III
MYINDKNYNTDLCDIVPVALAEALDICLCIIQLNTGNPCVFVNWSSISERKIVYVLKSFDHYDAIVPVVEQEQTCSICNHNVYLTRKMTVQHSSSKGNNMNKISFPSILSFNITGALADKLPEIYEIAVANMADIICITETWCHVNIPDCVLQLPTFNLCRRDREDGRSGGGLVCYIKDTLPIVKVWNELNVKEQEALFITIRPHRLPRGISHITVGIVYHPPKSNDWAMCEHLVQCVDHINQTFPNNAWLIFGDFNHMKDEYLKYTCQLKQIVKKATHMASVIDLCYTSLADIYSEPKHEPGVGLSRHHTLVFQPLNNKLKKPEKVFVTKRNESVRNKENLKKAITDINWTELYKAESCQEKYECFENKIQSLVDQHLPFHTVVRNSNDLPWVTDKFRRLIKKRQYHFHNNNDIMFRFFRNKVNRERKRLKKQHIDRTLQNVSRDNNARSWWKNIKQLIGLNRKDSSLITLAENSCGGNILQLAETINSNFQNVCSHLAPLSTPQHFDHDIPDKYIIPVARVKKQLKSLNIFKSPGPDSIPTWLLKEMADYIAAPVCAIYNSSFHDSYVPPIWKSANTCPLPKVSPPSDINKDLRPISLTPILSKGIEVYAREWFMEYFKTSIDKHQYGSQKECSTILALAQLIHNWLLHLEKPSTIIRILLIDFSKAFDLVDHNILIDKIKKTGVPKFLSDWCYNFLCGRRQRVKINNDFSSWVNMNAGVPQGTLLGPVAFLLHINDLSTVCESVKYVDDTTLWEACDSMGVNSKLQIAAEQVTSWCELNKMRLNTDKTKEIVINFTKNKDLPDSINIGNKSLERVCQTKLLGLIFNDTLTWGDHITYICKKAAKRLYFLRLLKRAGISPIDIVNVYCSIIRSLMEYACEIWHPNITKHQTNQLELIQKRAMKIAFPNNKYEQAITAAGIESLYDRRENRCRQFFEQLCKESHRLHYLMPPKTTYDSLRQSRMFQLPKVKTNRMKNSPIYYGLFRFQMKK